MIKADKLRRWIGSYDHDNITSTEAWFRVGWDWTMFQGTDAIGMMEVEVRERRGNIITAFGGVITG